MLALTQTDTPPDLAGPDGVDVPRDPQMPPGPDSKLTIQFPLEKSEAAALAARRLVVKLGRQEARLYAEMQRNNHRHINDGIAFVHRPEQWLYWDVVASLCDRVSDHPILEAEKVSA